MQPTVSHENNTYTFRLWREGKEVVHTFKDSFVTLYMGNEKSIPINQLARMNGPSYDGWTYYISAQPHEGDEVVVWLSKEEFDILQPIEYSLHVCGFCGSMESECGGDHADEMRESARESMRHHYDE
jgi:hypothetical protein